MEEAKQPVQEEFNLTPLTPEFNKDNHGSYVRRINHALTEPKIRNIALSGTYGIGKSSILQKVAEEHEKDVVEISLSTLAPAAPKEVDESIPKQASTITNRIQQEIVKQLLYRVESHNAPRSRFNRIESFNCKREHSIATLSGIVFTLLFLLMEWTEKIVSIHESIAALGAWIHVIVFFLLASCTFMARYLFQGRVNISQLSTGNAAISLDEKSVSYFDQYLDEIVYFFEVSEKNIVIFEDIDRFEDSHIFETLRSLNTLLNNAPQFKSKPIRFIYAIKDSIFDPKGLNSKPKETKEETIPPEEAEIRRANRTKFFDLIIPVVPFITHKSARSLVSEMLGAIDHKIDDKLIKLAARYVPDMRLLKNVRNEFIIFREKLFTGDDKQLDLSESELFAMMLYKSTHLSDFELIRLGKSKLDEIYYLSRKFVNENTKRISKEIRINTLNLTMLSKYGIEKRCIDFGERLISHIVRTARAVDYPVNNSNNIRFNGEQFSLEDLKSMIFWKNFTSNREVDTLVWYQFSNNNRLSFLRSDLEIVLEDNLDPDDWKEIDSKKIKTVISQRKSKLEFLRSATIRGLINDSQLYLDYNQSNQNFDFITREILSDGLAYQLIKSGYLNRNFTLYTSTFHDSAISATAQNFIIHNFEPNIMDEQLVFEERDIKSIISECGEKALSEPCFYNISILNYLLEFDHIKADIMIQSLIQFGEDEIRFLQAYLSGENKHTELIKKITFETVEVLEFLINQVELNNELRLSLISTALEHLNSELEYSLEDSVSKYLQEHYASLPILATSTNKYQAENIAELYSNASIRVTELKHLSEQICNAFIAKDLYEINVENLKIALRSETSLALDVALEKDEEIYHYLLRNLGKYLQAVVNNFKTVTSSEHFIRVIDDVLASKNPDDLDEVVENASDNCIIEVLDDVQTDAWQCLADFNRFTATFNNISSYISTLRGVDEYLEKVLIQNDAIIEHKSASQEEKEKLAINILNANKNSLLTKHRVQLVESLHLTGRNIHVSDLPVEKGELFPLLLKGKIIEDCADTYEHLLETDWSTRESYIEVSNDFKNYITPELLQGDLAAFLASEKIGLDIKVSVVERAEEFTVDCNKNDLIELAQFAINQDKTLSIDVVEKMTNNQVETRNIILLLSPHLTPSINSEQLFRILELLQGDYPKLISTGKDQPKIPNTPENQKLINTLKTLEIVNSFREIADGLIKVFKKHK
ncbi:P-loop NTPase fold protein [Marinomonas sp.]|uniref:YobI family P-loop NTPase n=1 Tax=Marinomonas sp. TaxID=1904862 RepID=UPI003A93C07C